MHTQYLIHEKSDGLPFGESLHSDALLSLALRLSNSLKSYDQHEETTMLFASVCGLVWCDDIRLAFCLGYGCVKLG